MSSHRLWSVIDTSSPILAPQFWSKMGTAALPLACAALILSACGGGDRPRTGSGGPSGTGGAPATTEVDLSCLPDCYRNAFETCQPEGACTVEVAPNPSAARVESWMCFNNAVTSHMIGTMDPAGNIANTTELSTPAGPCRRFEIMESAAGAFYTMKDGSGAILATATITSYPGMTIACANNTEVELDRNTPCGKAALTELNRPTQAALKAPCSLGACPH
jgi:hypothetical protein